MTYRNGAFVVDTREGRMAQVIGSEGHRVQVRQPGGGLEWEVPFSSLRLATSAERAAARANPEPPARPAIADCPECPALKAAWWEATIEGDPFKAGDALVAVRRHWRSHMSEGTRA
ncbi:hypothetical protein [Streptomyces aureoversilis]|uniref:Uncharacterized protein n=1 Tax=Streptomyces aureoversilis TaxID=67277 RepID=A0ABW0A5R0_9ACTN